MAKKARSKAPQMIVTSRMKDMVKRKKMRSDGALADGVNERIAGMVIAAVERAKANGRSTVRAHDL
jgi:hypothetical protein